MARRVNTKFLTILSVIIVGGVVTLLVLGPRLTTLFRGDRSKKALENAELLMKQAADPSLPAEEKRKKLEGAKQNYELAAAANPRDKELLVKYGDVLSKLSQYDLATYIRASRAQWDRALEQDPGYIPALTRLMESYFQETQLNPQAVFFAKLQETSTALHKLEPTNLRAASLMYIAPIHKWLANIETPASDIDVAMTELAALMEKDPTNADLPFYIAAAKAKRGVELKRSNQERQGNELLDQAVAIFDDLFKASGKDKGAEAIAYMHYRFFELLSVVRSQDRERDRTKGYTDKQRAELKRAKELVTPEDPKYVQICIAAFQQAQGLRDAKLAENILMEVRADPRWAKDQRIRLALAKLWRYNPAKQQEAVDLLELPMEDAGFEGVEARRKLGLEVDTWIELTNMYIDQYGQVKEEDARKKQLAKIDETYNRILSKVGEISAVLKLRGKMEILRGGQDSAVKAIETFEKAQAQYRVERNGEEDVDLIYLLARAYYAARQTGQARRELLKLVGPNGKIPDFIPARLMLAQLLVAEGETAAAREHVAFLQNQAPEEPEVVRLVLATLDSKEAMKVKSTFEKLPEETRAQRMNKAAMALNPPLSSPEDALRLYKLVLKEAPGDFDALQGARDILIAQDKKDDALALLKAGKAAAPQEKRIDLLLMQVEGATAEKIGEFSVDVIKETYKNDPLLRELKLYEFEALRKGRKEAFPHLVEAEKIKNNDGRVLDLMWQYYVGEQNWNKASEYVEKLAALNWDQAEGLIYRYRQSMMRNDLRGAVQHAQDLTAKRPYFSRSWVFLAQALQAQGQTDLAINNYNLALDKQSENVDALAGLVSCYFQRREYSEAARVIETGMKAHPNNTFFKQQWTYYHMNFGDPKVIIEPAKADRDAAPDDVHKWIQLGRAQYMAARKKDADSAKYIADAKQTFADAVKKFPGERVIWAFIEEISEFNKDLDGGVAALRDMASRPEFKDSPDPYLMLADHYLKFEKPADAEATMKVALEKFNTNLDVRRRLAAFYTQNKRYDEALKLLDPSSPEAIVRQQIVEILMLSGRFDDAEKLLRGLIQSNPSDKAQLAQLHALLGVVLLNQKKPEQAMESLNTSLGIDARNQAALYSRGQMRLQSGAIEDAIKDLQFLRDLNPNHIEGRVSLAEAFKQKQMYTDCARELEDALRRAPMRRDIRINVISVYAATKDWSSAERLLKEAADAEPREIMWMRMQAKLWSVRGQHEKAALRIRDALAIADEKMKGELLRDYMDILEAGKNWRQLLAECDQVFRASPQAANEAWWIYVKRAVANRNVDQKPEAMADFEKALSIAAADKNASQDVQIAIMDRLAENMGKEEAIRRVAALSSGTDAKSVRWKVVLAYLYMSNNQAKEATETIAQVRGQFGSLEEKDRLNALNVSGTIYMMNQQFPEAKAVYEELLAKQPDHVAALNNLACLWAEHSEAPDRLAKALGYSTKAYDAMNRQNRQDSSVLDTHGWVNVLSGGTNLDRGIELLNASVKAGEIPEAHYHLGEAYLLKKFPDAAKSSLSRAAEMLQERKEKEQKTDEGLKQKVDQAREKAEKALLEAAAKQ